MKTIKGPGIFLAQFLRDEEPYNNLKGIAQWAAGLGYKGAQIPTWDTRVFDLDQAAESKNYCDEIKGTLLEAGLEPIELASYLQGQCLAVHPAYETMFQTFFPARIKQRAASGLGGGSVEKNRHGLDQHGHQPHLVHVRRVCLAHDLPLAPAAGRHHR